MYAYVVRVPKKLLLIFVQYGRYCSFDLILLLTPFLNYFCIALICLCVPILLFFPGQLSHLPYRFWRWRN